MNITLVPLASSGCLWAALAFLRSTLCAFGMPLDPFECLGRLLLDGGLMHGGFVWGLFRLKNLRYIVTYIKSKQMKTTYLGTFGMIVLPIALLIGIAGTYFVFQLAIGNINLY